MVSHSRMFARNLFPSPAPSEAPLTILAMSTNVTGAGTMRSDPNISASLPDADRAARQHPSLGQWSRRGGGREHVVTCQRVEQGRFPPRSADRQFCGCGSRTPESRRASTEAARQCSLAAGRHPTRYGLVLSDPADFDDGSRRSSFRLSEPSGRAVVGAVLVANGHHGNRGRARLRRQ